jgi:Domain of unknown function (DUF4384)
MSREQILKAVLGVLFATLLAALLNLFQPQVVVGDKTGVHFVDRLFDFLQARFVSPRPAPPTPQPGSLPPATPALAVSLQVTSSRGDAGPVAIGDHLQVTARVGQTGRLYLVDLGTTGTATLLFPNADHPDPQVQDGEAVTLPAATARYRLTVAGPVGIERLWAITTPADRDLFAAALRPVTGSPFAQSPAGRGR